MPAIDWPTSGGRAFAAAQQDERLIWSVELSQARNGRIFTRGLPGAIWACTLQIEEDTVAFLTARRQLEAFLLKLRGGATRLNLWNLLTPTPRGTLTGSPTVQTTAAAGATSIALQSCNGTLLRGDRIQLGIGGQRVMVTDDATPVSSAMTVNFQPALRAQVTAGTAVVWDKPTSSYVLREPTNVMPVRADKLPGFAIEFVEAWE